tara:strand:- start:5198 stop:7237 length:2040 start_codon:yes stop_codon:yes gene_type:complete
MRTLIIILTLFFAGSFNALAQVEGQALYHSFIDQEDFEFQYSYETSEAEYEGTTNYFGKENIPYPTYRGFSNPVFYAKNTGTVSITFDDIVINGFTDLNFKAEFASNSFSWDTGDYVRISGSIDGGASFPLIWIENDGTSSSYPYFDDDHNGVGDVSSKNRLSSTGKFETVFFSGTGKKMSITIEINLGDSNDEVVLDNIAIGGYEPEIENLTVSGNAGWRLLSAPTYEYTMGIFRDDIYTQGYPHSYFPEAAQSNVYIYNTESDAWEEPVDQYAVIPYGRGVAIYFFDEDPQFSGSPSTELPVDIDTRGALTPDISTDLNTNANGYTLLGNPFNAPYDASKMTVSGGSIQNNIHFWDPGLGSYQVRDRTTPFIIDRWQGFFVQRDATGGSATISFEEADTVAGSATETFFSKEIKEERYDIEFSLRSDSTTDVATRLTFHPEAEFEYDLFDAGKLQPLTPQYAIIGFSNKENELKSVESLPFEIQEEVYLPMDLKVANVEGELEFSWKGMDHLPAELSMMLADYETGEKIDMKIDSSYSFDAPLNSSKQKVSTLSILNGPQAVALETEAEERFGITISPAALTSNEAVSTPKKFSLEQNYPNPFNPTTTIRYSVEEAGDVTLTVYNLMGQRVATLVNEQKNTGEFNVSWDASDVASGMYYYQLVSNGKTLTRKMTLIK